MIVEIASNMVGCLVVASLIGFIIGLIVGKMTKKSEASSIYKHTHDFKVHGNIYNRPIILSKPRPTGKDDLKEIEGIDSKIENDLNQLGIFHFDQIAKWSNKNCEWVNEYLKLDGKIENDDWINKANILTQKKQ